MLKLKGRWWQDDVLSRSREGATALLGPGEVTPEIGWLFLRKCPGSPPWNLVSKGYAQLAAHSFLMTFSRYVHHPTSSDAEFHLHFLSPHSELEDPFVVLSFLCLLFPSLPSTCKKCFLLKLLTYQPLPAFEH